MGGHRWQDRAEDRTEWIPSWKSLLFFGPSSHSRQLCCLWSKSLSLGIKTLLSLVPAYTYGLVCCWWLHEHRIFASCLGYHYSTILADLHKLHAFIHVISFNNNPGCLHLGTDDTLDYVSLSCKRLCCAWQYVSANPDFHCLDPVASLWLGPPEMPLVTAKNHLGRLHNYYCWKSP